MFKIMLNVFVIMLSANLFGATNKLLDPKTSVIVDVGYNNGTAHISKPFPKSIQDIPALSRQIDNAIILKKRDKLTRDCTVDQYGSKACPEEMVECTGTPVTNPGSAVVHNATSYAAKIPVTSAGYVLNNGSGGYYWGENILTNYGTPVGNHTYNFYAAEAGTYTFNLMIDNYGTMSVDGTQILSANNWPTNYSTTKTLTVGVHTININGANVDGPSGQAGTVVYNGSIIWNSRTGQPATTTYVCSSNPYSLNNPQSPGFSTIWPATMQILKDYNIDIGTKTFTFNAAVAGSYTIEYAVDYSGSLSIDGTQIISGNYLSGVMSSAKTLTTGTHTISMNSSNDGGPYGQAARIKFNGVEIWNTRVGQIDNSPSLYSDNGSNCKLDYTYSTYSCPVAPITEQAWIGPLTAGGDCGGIGVNAAKQCNSPTPPAGNCIQTNFSCPVGDEQNECVKTASTDSIAQNLFSGYKYAPGTATAHSNTISKPRLCAGQTLECSSLGQTYSVNPLNANECTSPLVLGDFQVSGYTQTNSNSLITNFGEKTYTSGKLAEKWNSTVGSWIDLSNPDNQHSSVNAPSTQHGHIEYDNGRLREVYDTLYGPWIDLSLATNQHSIISSKGHTEWQAGKLRERNSALSGTWIEICPNNQPLKAICETGSSYDSSSRVCSNGFKPKWVCNLADANLSNNICDLSQNYKFNASLNKCYLDKTGQTEDFIKRIYVAQKNTGFNTATDMCESPKTTNCSEPGYTFDPVIGECVGDYSCPGYWNAAAGKCEVAPTVSCDPGYTYNTATMRCEATPSCEAGTLNETSFKCEKNSDCKSGWNKDIGSGECTKPLESVNPICNESFMAWDHSQRICGGTADFHNWVEVNPWSTGRWSIINNTTLLQSENGPMPTFYLSSKEYESSVIKGKVSINSTSGDNDSVGIVFGYKNNTQYFVINWEKEAAGNSGGTYRMSLQQVNGGTPTGHGGNGGVTKGGVNVGWSYNTTYELEVRTAGDTVTVLLNGAQQFSVSGLALPSKGKIGFYNQSQNQVTYSDFYISTTPTCPTGFTYNKDQDNCYKELPGVVSDYDQGVYREPANCSINATYDATIRKCLYEPMCQVGGGLDYSRHVCAKRETTTCNSGLTPSPGISFDTCNLATICPTGYHLDTDNVSCSQNIDCPFVDPSNAVCYESEHANCAIPTAVVEPSINFFGFGVACADSNICYSGTPTKINGEWMCSKPVGTDVDLVCSGKVDGWGEILSCPAGTEKKWEENSYGTRAGPVCQLSSTLVTNPLQDYQINPTIASSLPEYSLWTPNISTMTCDRDINVLRCPKESATMIYTPVYPDGEYTGHKGLVGSLNVACSANVEYAKNIWTESMSDVAASNWSCVQNTPNKATIYTHGVPYADANTNQSHCASGWNSGSPATLTPFVSTTQNSVISSFGDKTYSNGKLAEQWSGVVGAWINLSNPSNQVSEVSNGGYGKIEYENGRLRELYGSYVGNWIDLSNPSNQSSVISGLAHTEWENGKLRERNSALAGSWIEICPNSKPLNPLCSSGNTYNSSTRMCSNGVMPTWGCELQPAVPSLCTTPATDSNGYWYTSYTQGTYTCTNNATYSSGTSSSLGGLGGMSGVSHGTCTGSFGTSATSFADPSGTGIVAYDQSLYNCSSSLTDHGNFVWTETCPTGFVKNTAPNGSITDITGVRDYSHRYIASAANFNTERCYKPSVNATGIDFVNDKYYITEFPIVIGKYKDEGRPYCLTPGLDYDSTLNRCVATRKDCTGVFNETSGKCEAAPLSVTCSLPGYTYNSTRARCEKPFTCSDGGIVNSTSKTCEKRVVDPCVEQHIGGYDMVCATSNVCPAGTTKIDFNGQSYCKSTKSSTCPDGYTFDAPSNKCFAPTYCEPGYKKEGNECKLSYNWSTYTCPTGWGDPLTAGADCHGECNSDGCWCNGSNAPANNCKQSLTVSNLSSTYELFEKRPIQKHFVTGGALSKEDFGELKNISCGQNCLFDVNKITGQGSDLCFEKSSNEKTCFTVNDCYFEGSIVNSNSDGSLSSIKKIDLLDPYSMGLVSTTSTTEIKGSVRLRYNANKGFDYSDGGTGGFSSWGDTWKSEGYSLARSAIKLSDGNWYVKATMPTGDSRACGFDSKFKTLPDSSYHVASYSSKCFAGATNIVNGCAMDITIDIPAGLSFIGYSDIESVASSEFMTAACNGDNKYDESFSVFNAIIPPAGAPVTRVGSGVQGSSSLNMVQLLCRTVYDPVTNTCAMSYENTILSSCRLNGHVGWSTREEGITSINLGEGISRWLDIDSNGTANLNPTNAADQGGISKWEGFNIGLMLLQLSDGNYYIANSMKGDDGIEIDRKLPGSIKKLSNSNYQFAPLNPGETTPVCMYKGKNTPNMCGRSLKIILPETKLYVLTIQDLESFNAVQIGGTKIIDNTFDLNMSINGNNYDYKGSGLFTPIDIVKEDTSVTDTTNTASIKDRLKFWDSFIDGDIGFIEFTRDVRNKDRIDNFVPENQLPYNMSKAGFTSLDFIPSMGKTIFVKPTNTSASECSAFASSVGGSVIAISSIPVAMLKTIYSLGGENSQACIIGNDKLDGFNSIEWAVRKNIYSGSFSYKCSPYICDGTNQCEIDTCPKETIGNPPVLTEYIGTLLPPAYNEEGCRDQKCDGKKPFIEFCGRQGACNSSQNSFTDASGHCFELYCNQGNLNVNKKTCEVMSCPQGTVPTTGGMCSR